MPPMNINVRDLYSHQLAIVAGLRSLVDEFEVYVKWRYGGNLILIDSDQH